MLIDFRPVREYFNQLRDLNIVFERLQKVRLWPAFVVLSKKRSLSYYTCYDTGSRSQQDFPKGLWQWRPYFNAHPFWLQMYSITWLTLIETQSHLLGWIRNVLHKDKVTGFHMRISLKISRLSWKCWILILKNEDNKFGCVILSYCYKNYTAWSMRLHRSERARCSAIQTKRILRELNIT